MSVYKDGKSNTWRVIYRYTDWTGERKQTQKRGFPTKREAQAWEHEQLSKLGSDLDMTFGEFVELYESDVRPKLKENTWESKWYVINQKLLPYFEKKKMCHIEPKDIMKWQNELRSKKDEYGKRISESRYKLAPTASAYTNFLNNLKECEQELREMFDTINVVYNE